MKSTFNYLKSLLMCTLVLASAAFVGCEDVTGGEGDGGGSLPTLTIVTEEGEEVSSLTISAPVEGTTYTFGVKTNATSWDVATEADWVTLEKADGVVTVSVAANDGDIRSAEVSLTTSSLRRVVTVFQAGTMQVDAIYYEAFGSVEATKTYGSTGTYWPYVDQFFEDGKMTVAGDGAAAVTYFGKSTSVRPTMASSGYEGASGVNSCLFGNGKADANVTVENIALNGATQLQLSFGISHAAGQNVYTTVAQSDIQVSVSANGADYVSIPVTIPAEEAWVLATSEFGVPAEASSLYIKFNVPMNADDQSAIRIDDIKLVEGGSGEILDLSTSSTPSVVLPTTAVSSLTENFSAASNYIVFEKEGWWYASNDRKYPSEVTLGWHGRTYGTDAYIAIAPYQSSLAEVVAYAGTLLNVKEAANKTLSFQLALYYQTEDDSKLEVVASTDFAGDVETATWTVVEDMTFAQGSTINEWKDFSVDLSQFADQESVYVAWRYTGKSNTYRLDNVAFNAEISDEPIVDQTTVTLPFELDGTQGKEQIENMAGVSQFGLGENYKNGNLKFGADQVSVLVHTDGAVGSILVEAYATGDAVNNAFEFLSSVDGVEYARIDSITMNLGKNVVQTITTTSPIPADARFFKIVYHKVTGSGTNASVSKIALSKAGESVLVPELSVAPVAITVEAEGATKTLTYKIKNFVGEAVPSFECDADWITIGEVTSEGVEVTIAENTTEEAREATITASVAGIEGSVEIVVSQSGVAGDEPEPEPEPEALSVAQVVALYDAGDAEAIKAAQMTGYVALVAEDASKGISARSLLVIDNTGEKNSGLMLYNITGTGLQAGDKVIVDLSTAEIATYNGLRELKGFTVEQFTKVEGESATITPVEIAATELGDYQSMLVSIKDVRAIDSAVGYKFCTADKNYTTKFTDGTNEFAVYCTKGYTALNDVEIGAQTATITGWVGCYNTPQLIPTVESAMQFKNTTPSFEVTPTAINLTAEGVTQELAFVLKNYAGAEVPTFTCDAEWITIGEVGSGSVAITFAENTSEESREATITATVAGIEGSVTITVKQAGVSASAVVLLYSTGFESAEGFTASTTYNNADAVLTGAAGQQWSTIFGTPSTTKPITGSQSMQMRCYTTSNTAGSSEMTFDLNGVTYVEFDAKNTNKVNVLVQYSTDGGSTWTGDETYTLGTSSKTYTYEVSESGVNARVKFTLVIPSGLSDVSRLIIDNVKVYGVSAAGEDNDVDFSGSID